MKELVRNEIVRMKSKGIIESCESEWAAPVVAVTKKTDQLEYAVIIVNLMT